MSRIAVLTPIPPQRTGIAAYSKVVLEHLAKRADVDVYASVRGERIPGVRILRASRRNLRRLDRYDGVIAQMGNSRAHDWILDCVQTRPTVVVLHELVLHHLVADMTVGRGHPQMYVDAVQSENGRAAGLLALAAVNSLIPPLWETAPERFPLSELAIRNATAVVVHSRFLAGELRRRWPDLPVSVAPFPAVASPQAPHPPRTDDTVRIGVFGFITKHKRLPVILEAFRMARQLDDRLRLVVVGEAPDGIDVARMAVQLGLGTDVAEIHGYAPGPRFDELVASVDLGVNLRVPTLGETSAIVAALLAQGKPVVVSPGGWYDELPDEAVLRVGPGSDEVETLAAVMVHLARDTEARSRMSIAAREYAAVHMNPSTTADVYLRAALAPVGRPALQSELIERMGAMVHEIASAAGVAPDAMIGTLTRAARAVDLL